MSVAEPLNAVLRSPTRHQWRRGYPFLLRFVDACGIVLAVLIANLARFGLDGAESKISGVSGGYANYITLSIVLAVAWWCSLEISASRDFRHLGTGSEEFKRVLQSTISLFGVLAILAYVLGVEVSRGYVAIALPSGVLLLLSGRALARRWFTSARRQGRFLRDLAVVGQPESIGRIVDELRRTPSSGLRPVRGITDRARQHPAEQGDAAVPTVSVGMTATDVLEVVRRDQVDAVAVSGDSGLSRLELRRLSWQLADERISLILSSSITDVAGSRIHTQLVSGTPFMHVSTPRLDGFHGFLKRAFDIVFSGLGLLVLSPLFAVLALLVRLDSAGPAFYRQARIGREGAPFMMYKFRSMVLNAHEMVPEMRSESDGNAVLFKMRRDPRVTRVGAWLRRTSLDELPQLWNVFLGDMSLVGPRPPLGSEVSEYERDTHRRLRATPGITGLWQVEGRSDLSWEESVRLDLYYVENWSLTGDFVLILRTVSAVLKGRGAY
jgi:exopolysaccharide biosynthesis polyprenyl glycosylphosphotransferase